MSCGYGNCGSGCEWQCPPWQVCIKPPCHTVSVPGPVMHCDTAPCEVSCQYHCGCNGLGGCYDGGYGGHGGYGHGCYGGYGGYGGYGHGGCGSYGWRNGCGYRC